MTWRVFLWWSWTIVRTTAMVVGHSRMRWCSWNSPPRWWYHHRGVVASSITSRSEARFCSQPSEYDLFNLPIPVRPHSEARKECYPKSHNLNWVEYWQPSQKWTKIHAEKSRCGVEDSRHETWTRYRHNRLERIDVEARMESVWFEKPMLETKKPTATRSPWKM